MKETTKILLKTKKELETHKLCKGAYAKKANGRTWCDPLDKDAKCLCFLGAMLKASNLTMDQDEILDGDRFLEVRKLFNIATRDKYSYTIDDDQADVHRFNDQSNTTKQDVLNVLDAMIALSKLDF